MADDLTAPVPPLAITTDVAPPAPEPVAENPYARAVAEVDRQDGQLAKTNMLAAAGATPDTTARALPIAKRLGVPVDTVERNLPDFEAMAKADQYQGVLRDSPMVRRWMTEPVNARLSIEDLPKLAGTESLWRGLMDTLVRAPAKGAVGTLGSTLAGLGRGLRAVGELPQNIIEAFGGPKIKTFDMPWFLAPSEILRRPGETIKGFAEDIGVPAARENMADKIVGGVGQIGAQIAQLVATGGTAGVVMLFGQGVDQMADEVDKSGKGGTLQGNSALLAGGAVTAITEKIGLDLLLNRVPPAIKSKFLRVAADLVLAGGIEAAEEAIEAMGQNVLANYYLNANKALLEGVVDQSIPAGGSAMLVRALLLGLGARRGGKGQKQGSVAEDDAQGLDRLYAGVRETIMGQKAPDKMAEFLASSGQQGNVYVPAEVVRTYLQGLEPEEAIRQARAIGIEGQLSEALATGGDVVIPLHQYVAHAPEDMAAAWRDDLRLRSTGMSVNETKAFEKSGADKELGAKVAERLDAAARETKARDDVVALVERQLQMAGESPEAARQIATLYGERYAARAARLGRGDAMSAYKASGVEFRSDLPESLKFAPVDDLELLIRAMKGKRDRSEANGKGPTILQFIAGEGGIIDDAGELQARGVDRWHQGKAFQRKAVREAPQPVGGGLPGFVGGTGDRSRYGMDAWALRLWENGFFPEFQERPSIDDMLAAIDQEMRGKPRRLEPRSGKEWVDDFQRAMMDMDELLTRAGVDARTASMEEIRAALASMEDQDGETYEQGADGKVLVAVHNLSARNLAHVVKMGGIAAPSLAIVKGGENPFTSFGEISLIAPPSMIDPAQSDAKVFGADVYSPRYPEVSYKIKPAAFDKFEKEMAAGVKATGKPISESDVENSGAKRLADEPAVMWEFLTSIGVEPKVVMKEGVDPARVDALKAAGFEPYFPKEGRYFDWQQIGNDPTFQQMALDFETAALRKVGREDLDAHLAEMTEGDKVNFARRFARDMQSIGMPAEPSSSQTTWELRKQIDEGGLQDQFNEYVDGLMRGLKPVERIFKGFTNSGNRSYKPHTIDVVLRELTRNIRDGEGFSYGVGNLRAKVTTQFKSIAAIKKGSDKIVSKADFTKVKDEVNAQFEALAEEGRQYNRGLQVNTFVEHLREAIDTRSVGRMLREYYEGAPAEFGVKIADFLNSLRNMPTEYFEAKIKRVVGLDEFAGAVVPDNASPKTLQTLKDAGITDVRPYKSGDDQDRMRAVSEFQSRTFFQAVFHGSPHIFDKFTTDHIGSGEGAQAYGWGLYFAGNKAVAKYYREALTKRQAQDPEQWTQEMRDALPPSLTAPEIDRLRDLGMALRMKGNLQGDHKAEWSALNDKRRTYDDAVEAMKPGNGVLVRGEALSPAERLGFLGVHLRNMLNDMDKGVPFDSAQEAAAEDLHWRAVNGDPKDKAEILKAAEVIEGLKDGDLKRDALGRLYHVEIPDDGEYLDWDKPLSEMPPPVQAAVEQLNRSGMKPLEDMTHEELGDLLQGVDRNGVWSLKDQMEEFGEVLPRDEMLRFARDEFKLDEYRGEALSGSGQGVYRTLSARLGGDKAASLALLQAGVPGIKYLDGGSRSRGEGSHNFVIFDGASAAIRQYEQEARGNITFSQNASGDARSIITLFKARNLSTVLHETGHLWLEELHADAREADAPQQLKDDLATVRKYLGIADGEGITVEQHETWARTVEAYMMEGKSPSVALSPVLARFKAWMVSIYRTMLKLNAPISDEVRGVLDRMIATDEAIMEARSEMASRELFTSAEMAGMTAAEFKAYQDSVTRSKDRAEQRILGELMDQVRRQRTAEWKEEAAKVRDEVEPMIASQPDLKALAYLRKGDLPDGLEHLRGLPRMRLSRDALIAEYANPEIVKALPRSVPPLVVDQGGVGPGEIAEFLGFSDGRAMIDALTALAQEQAAMKAAGDKRSVRAKRVEEEVDRVMKERHGDMLSDGSIEAEALSALHNEARSDVLAAEVRQLARTAGREVTPYRIARDWAKRSIAEKQISEIGDLSQYTRAEARAARLAEQALTKGDGDEALRRKQEQMIAHALWMEARDAKDEIEKARRTMDRLAGTRTSKSMDQEYLERIHEMLERFDLKARSMRSVERSESLRAWADEQRAAGVDIAVPDKLLDEAYRTSYRRMTVEEFRGLADSVQQLAHLGRMKRELLDGKEKREFEAVVDEAVATAAAQPQRGVSGDDTGLSPLQEKIGKLMSGIRSGDASLLKIETMLEWLDGDKTGRGVFTRIAFRPIAEAQGRERDRLKGLTDKLGELYAAVPDEQRAGWLDVMTLPQLPKPGGRAGKWNKTQLISMALNIGNESNLEKLLKGYGWSDADLRSVLNKHLTREEWQFVQGVWDLIETQWPDLAAVHRRVNGVEPPKIERTPVETPYGTLPGGYYKVAYDGNLSIKAEKIGDQQDLAASVGQIFPSGMTRPSTRAGATHERTNFEAPIRLSLDLIPQQLTDAAHDIEFREAILNAHKFLSDNRVKQAIQEALGPEYERKIRPWLQNVAHEWQIDRQGLTEVQKFAGVLRTNVTIVGLGFRITTMLAQVAGYSNSIQRLGAPAMADGFRTYSLAPFQQTAWVREKSAEMRNRANDLERDMRAAQLKLQGKTGALNDVRRLAFQGIAMFDAAVSIPTWLGAYNKGLKQGMADEEAVYFADKMVRDTQGAGAAKDMAAIQRGDPILKLFTMFYSYFNVFYNRQRSLVRDIRDPNVSWGSVVNQTFFLLMLPALASALLTGQGPEDEETWLGWSLRNVTFGLFTGVPYGRDLANAASNKIAGKNFGGAKLSPVEGFGENLVRLGQDAANLLAGEDTSKGAVKNVFNVTGVLTALPLGQVGQTTQYVWDVLVAGSEQPDGVVDWLKGLTFGPEKKK